LRGRLAGCWTIQAIETALSSLAAGIVSLADEFEDLDDVISAYTNSDLHRLQEFTNLRDACGSNGHVLVGSTLTLVRRATKESMCLAVGVSSAPPLGDQSDLLSWQFGFWLDATSSVSTFVSPVYALPADAGGLIVLEQLRPSAEDSLQQFISESGMTVQAFISYVREDAAVVDQLGARSRSQGIGIFRPFAALQ
jgi:hypothetical protein